MSRAEAPSFVVRAAQISDGAVLAATIATAFAEYRGKLVPESSAFLETPEKIATELSKSASALMAHRGDAAAGCVMIKREEGDLYFGRLSVLPEQRGHGVARLLVDAVEAEARRLGLPGVRLGVRIALPENQRLFAALGYVEIARVAHPGFMEPTYITMRKAL